VVQGNADWQARSLASVWHPCTQMQRAAVVPPLPIARAHGPWLYDQEGNRYFDANSSWWVNLFGHADEGIVNALKQQLDVLPHVMLAGCTHAPAIELAERLSARTGGVLGHAFYASDGASAVEIALKMSFHHWRNVGQGGKREFVCVRQGYHGETLGALAVTDVPVFRDAYDPLLMRSHQVASPDDRQAAEGEDAAAVAQRAAADLEALLAERHAHIAAVIVEPLVQCAAGMAMHHASYLQRVRALCDQYSVHLIADEIAVGCGARAPSSPANRRAFGPISCACPRASREAFCRCRWCCAAMPSTAPSCQTTWRAASCTRIPTPATRWPAGRRWPCSTASTPRTYSAATPNKITDCP